MFQQMRAKHVKAWKEARKVKMGFQSIKVNFMPLERTLVIIKPDAVKRGLIGEIISRFERKGLKIVAIKMKQLNKKILEQHYAEHKGKAFYEPLLEFMSSGPVVLMIIEGKEAIAVVRKMCGATNAREAEPGTIRGSFAMSVQCNVVHASADKEAADREIKLFFTEDEICSYGRFEELLYAKEELK